jgi:hypothetical protein
MITFSFVPGRTVWKIVKGSLTWLTDQKTIVSVINSMKVREKWRHKMRTKKRRFALCREVQEMICCNWTVHVHLLWTHQWRRSVMFDKDTNYFGEEQGYYTLDKKSWVSIHYLGYTLGLVPVLTKEFLTDRFSIVFNL